MTRAVATPKSAPDWSSEQLHTVLALLFGFATRGGPDIDETAKALSVSTRQVRRWLSPTTTKTHTPIPDQLAAALAKWVRPDDSVLEQETKALRYADGARRAIAQPQRSSIPDSWTKRGWLTPHTVAVVARPQLGLLRATISRATDDTNDPLANRGQILDEVTVTDRFSAQVVKAELLRAVDPWRAQAPPSHMARGNTETWLIGCPQPTLAALVKGLVDVVVT